MRRQRTTGPSGVVTHSQVARPSGPLKDQVISQTPVTDRSGLTRRDAGHRAAPFDSE